MTTIRPNLYPQTQARPQPADSGKLAAQRAFFDTLSQARGQAQATSSSTTTAAPTAAAATQRTTPATSGETPSKILRPGSLFDIRV